MKPRDVAGAQYVDVENVDLQQTVDDFKARWLAQAKLDVRPSLVTLRLVKCGARKPSSAEEAAAAELDDPSLMLREAGVTGTAWLLAVVIGACGAAWLPACLQAAHALTRRLWARAPYSAGACGGRPCARAR